MTPLRVYQSLLYNVITAIGYTPGSSTTILGTSTSGFLPLSQGGFGTNTAAGARAALDLGSLATQSGTFSGTSSGTNTGDEPGTSTPTASAIARFDGTGKLNINGVPANPVFVGTVTADYFSGNGAGLTGILASVAFSAVTGSATSNQLPIILEIVETSTAIIGTDTPFRIQHFTGTETYKNAELILKFNNPGTSVFLDNSDNSFAITANGEAIGTTTSRYGSGALYLDGSGNDYITIPDSPLFDAAPSEIITFWINPLAIAGTTGLYIQEGGDGTLNNNVDHWVNLLSGGDISWNVQGTGWNPGFTIPTLAYTFVELNYQDGVAYAFQNGTLLGTSTANRPTGIAGNPTLGKGYTGASNYFNGLIDQFVTQRNVKGHTTSYTAPDYFLLQTLNFIPAGTTTPSFILGDRKTISGYDNSIALAVKISGNIDSTSDVFISFRDSNNTEQGSIACSGVANVVALNSGLLTHYCYIADKTGLQSLDVLEAEGNVIGEWTQLEKLAWVEVEEPELDIAGSPIYEVGTGTEKKQKFVKMNKLIKSNIKIEGQSPKKQLTTTKICSKEKSSSAWGTYMGTKSNGVDIIATTGTGLAKVINTGFNLIPGDLLCSSNVSGYMQLQEGTVDFGGGISLNDRHLVMDYTIATVNESVVWEAGEQARTIAVNIVK